MRRDLACIWRIEPGLRRQVVHPPVLAARVVGDHVHYHTDAMSLRFCDKLAVAFVRTETRVHQVVIGDGIAVVGPFVHRVLEERIDPQLRVAHVRDVAEMLAQALDGVSLVGASLVGVTLDVVVRRVAIGEAVRRDQVDDIARVVGADVIGYAYLEFVATGDALVTFLKDYIESPRLGRTDIARPKAVWRANGFGLDSELSEGDPAMFTNDTLHFAFDIFFCEDTDISG